MDMKQHSSKCTQKYQKAEIASKINLFDSNCPRCRLNYAAPELFKALTSEINAQAVLAGICYFLSFLNSHLIFLFDLFSRIYVFF